MWGIERPAFSGEGADAFGAELCHQPAVHRVALRLIAGEELEAGILVQHVAGAVEADGGIAEPECSASRAASTNALPSRTGVPSSAARYIDSC